MGDQQGPPGRAAATAVHVLTALGAVCAFMATLAALGSDWRAMFAWLGLALVIDAVDGPLARRVDVHARLPRFSGDRLDLIIDYLTYVFVPTLALYLAGYLKGTGGMVLACAVLVTSLFHFADTQSKTHDHHFVGFPAIWNVVALYVFAWNPPPAIAMTAVAVFAGLTIVPIHWVHPVRVETARAATAFFAALWAAAAVWIVAQGLPAAAGPRAVLTICGVYGVGISVWMTWRRASA